MSGFDGEYNDGFVDGYMNGMIDLVEGLKCRLKFHPELLADEQYQRLFELVDDVQYTLEKRV